MFSPSYFEQIKLNSSLISCIFFLAIQWPVSVLRYPLNQYEGWRGPGSILFNFIISFSRCSRVCVFPVIRLGANKNYIFSIFKWEKFKGTIWIKKFFSGDWGVGGGGGRHTDDDQSKPASGDRVIGAPARRSAVKKKYKIWRRLWEEKKKIPQVVGGRVFKHYPLFVAFIWIIVQGGVGSVEKYISGSERGEEGCFNK